MLAKRWLMSRAKCGSIFCFKSIIFRLSASQLYIPLWSMYSSCTCNVATSMSTRMIVLLLVAMLRKRFCSIDASVRTI